MKTAMPARNSFFAYDAIEMAAAGAPIVLANGYLGRGCLSMGEHGCNWISCEFCGGSKGGPNASGLLTEISIDVLYWQSLLTRFENLKLLRNLTIQKCRWTPKTALNLVSPLSRFPVPGIAFRTEKQAQTL